MKRTRHALHLMGDLPNAVRVRAATTSRAVPAAWSSGPRRPAVLLPGVYETWHFMAAVGNALNAAGHPVHAVLPLGYNRAPIPASATLVARDLAAHDLTDVALVAHSKGGLIGKHLMANDDPDHRVDRLVGVAVPFGGSAMARLVVGRTLRAFLPSDPVIRALVDAGGDNHRVTSIYPHFDPNIPEGSYLDGATNVEIPVVGHFRILDAPATVAAVVAAVAAVQREDGTRG